MKNLALLLLLMASPCLAAENKKDLGKIFFVESNFDSHMGVVYIPSFEVSYSGDTVFADPFGRSFLVIKDYSPYGSESIVGKTVKISCPDGYYLEEKLTSRRASYSAHYVNTDVELKCAEE